MWPRDPMDKASDYESGDSRIESWRGRLFSQGKRGKTLAQIFYEKQQGGQIVFYKDNKKGFLF